MKRHQSIQRYFCRRYLDKCRCYEIILKFIDSFIQWSWPSSLFHFRFVRRQSESGSTKMAQFWSDESWNVDDDDDYDDDSSRNDHKWVPTTQKYICEWSLWTTDTSTTTQIRLRVPQVLRPHHSDGLKNSLNWPRDTWMLRGIQLFMKGWGNNQLSSELLKHHF